MDDLLSNQATLWLLGGFLLLAIEAVAFGFGSGLLLFGSLAAIITGLALWFSFLPNQLTYAIACFAISSALLALVLWRPLKALQRGNELGNDRSSDLIGHQFLLSSDIQLGSPGQQKYSGIDWRVEPAQELSDPFIAAGTQVQVSAVQVGVFFVEPVKN